MVHLKDDLLNIDKPYFEGIDNEIYPPELQWNRTNASNIETPTVYHPLVLFHPIYDKQVNVDFDMVDHTFWTVTRPVEPHTELTFHILLDLFACSHVNDLTRL